VDRPAHDTTTVDAHLRHLAGDNDPRPAHVVQDERVGEAAKDLLARLETLQQELDRLLGGLRTTAETLSRRPDDESGAGR
jgi:hypothetical protein